MIQARVTVDPRQILGASGDSFSARRAGLKITQGFKKE